MRVSSFSGHPWTNGWTNEPREEKQMTYDEIADLADRLRAKQRRGEDPDFEFEIEFGALTADEQDAFVALLRQRTAHGQEGLKASPRTCVPCVRF
jgi:hypothetical protein